MNQENENPLDKINKMPVYIKAQEICELCIKITEIIFKDYPEIEDENKFNFTHGSESDMNRTLIKDYAMHIRENATIIPAKIAGAEGGDLYDIRMENAAIIRKCAREIYVNCMGLKINGFKDLDYLQLLRNEIDEFKPLFAEWVKTFDKWNYIIDRWGLFNPPGINYDDYQDDY